MDETLETQLRNRFVNDSEIIERYLTGQDSACDAQVAGDGRTGLVVHCHLRRTMDLERRVDGSNQPHESYVLYDRGIDTAVDRLS